MQSRGRIVGRAALQPRASAQAGRRLKRRQRLGAFPAQRFAVGRTSFWDALSGLRDKKISREQAVEDIAGRYSKWVKTFEDARKAG